MISSKSYGLQNETRQYLRRLYAYGKELAGTDVNDVDNFIKGLKQLNLWQNIVCWPMRSIHNIGTGSTVLSLGGLGVYNGSMVNSPTWSNSGIGFTSTTQEITRSGLDTPSSPLTFGMVNDKANTAATMRTRFWGTFPRRYADGDAINSRSFTIRNSGNSNYYTWSPTVTTDFIFKSVSITSRLTAEGYANGTFVTPSITLANIGWDDAAGNNSNTIVAANNASDTTIRVAFFWAIRDVVATASQHSFIYALYKQTIGKGLGLP